MPKFRLPPLPVLVGIIGRVIAVLVALQLAYLVVANAVLRSALLKRAVAGADGMHLEYASAWSFWPGRAHLSGLTLRIEDYNVQFQLTLERADLDVGLDELLRRRLHIFRLRADGVRCFLRHKVHEAQGHEARLAAFPHIAGFVDPPLYQGPEPAPIPDDQYDLWQVQIEDVVARAKELWFLEYRFRGDAEARGAFLIRPARLVQVGPAKLEFVRGVLDVGPRHVAQSVSGNIEVALPHLDVPKTEGAAVFREISARAQLELAGGELGFAAVYLDSEQARVEGPAHWSIRANIEHGVVRPGTELVLDAQPLRLTLPSERYPNVEVSGAVQARLSVEVAAPEAFHFRVAAQRLELGRSSRKTLPHVTAPALVEPELDAVLSPTDLAHPVEVRTLHGKVPRLDVTNLFWFEPWLSKDGSVRLDGAADAQVELRCNGSEHACQVERLGVEARGARLALGDRASEPFAASLSAAGLTLRQGAAPHTAGRVSIHASSGRAFLPLITSLPIKDAVASLLALSRVDAELALEQSRGAQAVALLKAQSGGLTGRGYAAFPQRGTRGALLLSTGLLKFGVTLRDGETSVSPFVGDDWLERMHP